MIYLIVCSETNTCKIGYSKNPNHRLKNIQTGHPYQLHLECIIEGDIKKEKETHSIFSKYKLNGEWFNYTNEIKQYFDVDDLMKISHKFWDNLIETPISVSDIIFLGYLYKTQRPNRIFQVTNEINQILAKQFKKSPTSFNKCPGTLCKYGFLIKVKRGFYMLNPIYIDKKQCQY